MIKSSLLAGSFMLLGLAAAHAQGAPNPPPPPPPAPMQGMMHGPMDMRRGYMEMRAQRMMAFQKAAAFRFRKDGAEIDIKCSSDENTKACVDAAGTLIDKIVGTTQPHP